MFQLTSFDVDVASPALALQDLIQLTAAHFATSPSSGVSCLALHAKPTRGL